MRPSLDSILSFCALALLTVTSSAAASAADESPRNGASSRITAEERPFAFVADPTTPSSRTVGVNYDLGLASGVAASRPLPATSDSQGIVQGLTGSYGITDRVAPFVTGLAQMGPGDSASRSYGVNAGVRFQLTDPSSPFRLTIVGAGFREFGGTYGVSTRVAASVDVGRVRVAGNLYGERAFASGRDGLDLLLFGGVSFRVNDSLRLGAEYVAQDAEDAFEHDVEGGIKHFVGPNVALDLAGGRVQFVASPAFGLNAGSPRALGRASLLVTF
jgi:hypothetical protein